VNYIRSERQNGMDPRPLLAALPLTGPWPWKNDVYLVPVIENDAMMLYDWGEKDEGCKDGDDDESFRLNLVQEQVQGMDLNDPAVLELIASASRGPKEHIHNDDDIQLTSKDLTDIIDNSYFTSYAFFDIHREMLQDKVRTDCYRRALEENPGLIQGSTVLDVGCGTGVLSMFASRGGAAQVLGVDGSPPIARVAEEICRHNGFNGGNGLGKVSIISSKVEELSRLPIGEGHVDVIVSEWMGM
jgi:protein arginine N-methyltransferase 3